MYSKFLSDIRAQHPEVPHEPDLDLGLAIKQIRLRMGMTQDELAKDARIKPNALKTLENGYSKFTKSSNLDSISRVLRVSPEEILLEAREWFSGNFYVAKQIDPPDTGKRKKKRRIETWVKRKPLAYDGYSIDISTPAISSPAHFNFCLIEIQAGSKAENLQLPYVGQIAGFVQRGSLRILYEGDRILDVFGNQGFSLQGDKLHHFHNTDPDNPLRIFVAFPAFDPSMPHPLRAPKTKQGVFGIGNAIKNIRMLYSPSKEKPLSYAHLASLTGIDEKSLLYLEKTKDPDKVIYWDKIEKISQALGIPFSALLNLASNYDEGYLQLATAHDRALIDYRHYIGVRIKSVLLPSPLNSFHMAETYIEPKKGLRRASWKRRDDAMISIYVEDGDLRLEIGKNRKTRLKAGESLYFDGSLGYIFANPGQKPCKIIMATYPAIVF